MSDTIDTITAADAFLSQLDHRPTRGSFDAWATHLHMPRSQFIELQSRLCKQGFVVRERSLFDRNMWCYRVGYPS